jgi:hypothetical protein
MAWALIIIAAAFVLGVTVLRSRRPEPQTPETPERDDVLVEREVYSRLYGRTISGNLTRISRAADGSQPSTEPK